MALSSALWLALAAGVLILLGVWGVRRTKAARPPELGSVSGQWVAESRAGQPDEDPAR